jgi:hypothetical protein
MIIWLASYPKSGNTWVRLFIDCLLYSNTKKVNINKIHIRAFPIRKDFESLCNVAEQEEFLKSCEIAQDKVNLDNKVKIFKTHHALWKYKNYIFTNEENTLGTIHIVRDPRNIITSIKNHYSLKNYDDAFEFLRDEENIIGERYSNLQTNLPTIISSWANHYNSWKKFKKNYLLIKYENLLNKPNYEFLKITKYLEKILNKKFTEKEIKNAINNCKFKNLQNQEAEKGFVEAVNKKDKSSKFFYLGPNNKWEKILNIETKGKIENYFRTEMKKLNYL